LSGYFLANRSIQNKSQVSLDVDIFLLLYGLEKLIFLASIGYVFYLRPESVGPAQHILAGIPLGPHLNHLPRAVVGAGCENQ